MGVSMSNRFKLSTIITIFITWGLQIFHLAYLGVLIGIIAPPPLAIAMNDSEFLASVYDDYDFGGDSMLLAQTSTLNDDHSNLEGYLVNKAFNARPSQPTDYSKYDTPITSDKLSKSAQNAKAISTQVAAPALDGGGNIQTSYKTKGKTDIQTTDDGNVVIQARVDQGGNGTNVGQEEYVSTDMNHAEMNFSAQSTYGDNQAFISKGKQTRSRLQTGSTQDAVAYRTLMKAQADNPKRDISPLDPVFISGANEVKKAAQGKDQWFLDCQNITVNTSRTIHVPDWKDTTCKQPKRDNPNQCEITRDLHVPIYVVGGTGHVEMCGPNCAKVRIGQAGDNYWNGGTCKQFFNTVRLKVDERVNVTQARVVMAEWDDHMRVWLGNEVLFSHVDRNVRDANYPFNWLRPSSGSPDPTPRLQSCETKKSWNLSNTGIGQIDVTNLVQNALTGSTTRIFELKQQVAVGDVGEGHLEVELHFDGVAFEDKHIQEPAGCYDKVKASTGICKFDSFEPLEVGNRGLHQSILNIGGPLYPGDTGNLTWKTNLKGYFCDPLQQNPLTVTLNDGTQRTLNYDDIRNMPDGCAANEANPACYKKSETCTEGWFDVGTNECYMKTVEYSCDVGVTYTQNSSTTTNTCAGLLNCSGGDCFNFGQEVNGDFDQAAAMMQVVNNMNGDAECDDPNDPTTCRVFNGEAKYCSWAAWIGEDDKSDFGANCCIAPDGINFMDYISATHTMYQASEWVATAEMVPDVVQGAWKNVHQPIADGISSAGEMMSNAWSSVTDTFSGAADMLAGNAAGTSGGTLATTGGNSVATGGSDLATGLGLDTLKQEAMNYAYEIMGPDLGGVFFQPASGASGAAGNVALTSGMQTVASIVSVVMIVYAAYQFIKLALNLLTACDNKEKDMGMRIALKQCFKTSGVYCGQKVLKICVKDRRDYCCYDSILSRIIMKQAYDQVGFKAGCEGLTPQEISQLDWSQIDLSEWIALMKQGDLMPVDASDLTQEELTGSGRFLNNDTRENITDRMENRLDGNDLQDRAYEAKEYIKPENLDCSQVPRPLACDWN